MAPKRSAPPPPRPPPAASSEETASGSDTDESEEEEIAHSPPLAAPKSSAPQPPGPESEGSDEDEDDEEDEEEEDEKAHHVTPPFATKNPPPPPPPPNREESESSDEYEEETDDEATQPKTATIQEAEGKGPKPSSSSEDKKPAVGFFQRIWSTDDEVRILEVLAAHCGEHGTLPQPEALKAALTNSLDKSGWTLPELKSKVKNLKRRYKLTANKDEPPSKDHERRLFDLSKKIWGAAAKVAANGGAQRRFSERWELYPYLAEEVKAHEKEQPGLFKRVYAMIDDDKARALDLKIKKHRMVQMKLQLRRYELNKEVTKTLMDLVD